MVTTNFVLEFAREKAEEEAKVSIEKNDIRVEQDGMDVSNLCTLNHSVEKVTEVFDLDLQEAVEFDEKLKEFGGRREVTDSDARAVEKYRESYGKDKTSKLAENLRVQDKNFSLGQDLWNFLRTPEADILAENAEAEVDEILEAESDGFKDEIDEILEAEYKNAANEAYDTFENQISEIAGLAEISGENLDFGTFDVFNWLKGKQYDPNWNEDIDVEDIKERLESQLDSQKRRKTLNALYSQAHKRVEDTYREITGSSPEEVDKDLVYGVRAHMMTNNTENRQLLEDIIQHDEDVYFQNSSPSNDVLGTLEKSEFETFKSGLGTKKYHLGDKEVEIYVASPIESLKYGDEFDTCHSITWDDHEGSNEGVIKRSGSLTSPVIFAEDENGNLVGRDRMIRTEDRSMSGLAVLRGAEKIYTSLEDSDLNSELTEAMKDYQEEMRLEMGYVRDEKTHDIQTAVINTDVYEEWHDPEYV